MVFSESTRFVHDVYPGVETLSSFYQVILGAITYYEWLFLSFHPDEGRGHFHALHLCKWTRQQRSCRCPGLRNFARADGKRRFVFHDTPQSKDASRIKVIVRQQEVTSQPKMSISNQPSLVSMLNATRPTQYVTIRDLERGKPYTIISLSKIQRGFGEVVEATISMLDDTGAEGTALVTLPKRYCDIFTPGMIQTYRSRSIALIFLGLDMPTIILPESRTINVPEVIPLGILTDGRQVGVMPPSNGVWGVVSVWVTKKP
ncbi:hypothetical protein GE061_007744 [Apolygus lucorum]|uniref:Uncharacterized protein n=1 Tax=Apolygus lucorum TaxID=248454 RepID=A0A8S9WP75_APOLU|nr:hypothetical protein GE061_007744 [Apolygus lucorum]